MTNMNEMMNTMMNTMMEKMMENMMTAMMQNMMAAMTPEVTPAEVEKPKKTRLTKEEFFALEEVPSKPKKDLSNLDFEPINATTLGYNGYVPSDIWIINHLAITRKYNGKWSSKLKGYKFETHADAVNFAQSYQIKTTLDENDRHNIKIYKQERAKAKAEYYAKKAEQ